MIDHFMPEINLIIAASVDVRFPSFQTDGRLQYESRSEVDVPFEALNLIKKQKVYYV